MFSSWGSYGKPLLTYGAVPVLCALISVYLGLDISWDVQNYHLYNAWAHLHERYQLDLAPAGAQSFFNPLFDLFWYGLLQILPLPATGFVLGLLHGLNFVLLRAIALELLGHVPGAQRFCWLLAALALLSVGFLSELGTVMHDNLVALLMLTALLLALRSLTQSPPAQQRSLLLAGVVAGIVCAGKLTGAIYALALAIALLAESWLQRPRWQQRLLPAAIYSASVAVTMLVIGGYWYWFNWHNFGNPLFPLFNNMFGSELATPESHRDERFLPTRWVDWLFRPVLLSLEPYLASEYPYRQYGWALLFFAVLIAVCVWAYRRRQHRAATTTVRSGYVLLGTFAVASWLLWLKLFGIYRYLITLELLVPLLMVLVLIFLLGERRGCIATLVIFGLLAIHNVKKAPDWGHAAWAPQPVAVVKPADAGEMGAVLLMGQPLAWLVPAFDLPVPFIQLLPNFHVGPSYQRAISDRIDGSRPLSVIFDPAVHGFEQTAQQLAQSNYQLAQQDCEDLKASMGQTSFTYHYCRVTR